MAARNTSSEEKNVEQTGKLKNKELFDFCGVNSGANVVKLCYGDLETVNTPLLFPEWRRRHLF